MSNFTYYLLWLAGGLVAIAIISATIAGPVHQRLLRRVKAVEVLAALGRYSDWVAAQQRTPFFQGDAHDESPLQEVHKLRQQWFPELSAEAAEILSVHARMIDFLWTQQLLRLSDPEAWLESDHDRLFIELWRLHARAVYAAADKLRRVAGAEDLWPAQRMTAAAYP
ncbi:MAG: hypothetical protein H0X13_06095 [Ramlibacter sp.]|nr:hypothetical protein [Ramlibacter sp.]